MISAKAVIAGFIGQHEGELSVHPADNGNWYSAARFRQDLPQARNLGQNVGSKFGVTAYALVSYRLRRGWELDAAVAVTRATMAALDLDTAIDIGVELYLREPKLDRLPWNRVTASVLDKAWGSGPDRAIRMLQQLLAVAIDGDIGPRTIYAYERWLAIHGEERAAHLWCDKRISFDQSLAAAPGDPDRAFVRGWNNRSRSFLPGTRWWRDAGR